MPQPITHMFICEQGMRGSSAGANLWSSYSNFARFGSFGPDLFYIRGTGFDAGYLEIADLMHAEGSLPFYCSLLDSIKAVKDKPRADKMKAFAYGFYAHVVADVVFHPFVYRRTMDHWLEHPEAAYAKHKDLECLVDNYILSQFAGISGFQGADVDLDCHDSDGMLDKDVYAMYLQGLYAAYANFPDKGVSWRFEITDMARNPIQMSYAKYNLAIGAHCYMLRKKHKNMMSGKKVLPLDAWSPEDSGFINTKRANWFPSQLVDGLDYTVDELLGMASRAVSDVVTASESFFNEDVTDTAQQFLASLRARLVSQDGALMESPRVRFFCEDYNLDTGLPSSMNHDPANTSRYEPTHFAFQAQELASRYAAM